MNKQRIVIFKNQYGEYEVPTNVENDIYYTDDKQDAEDTARAAWHFVELNIVHKRGTYGE